jgi:6-hydroxymethylpterin diphosphokinase MptE-like
MNDTRGSFGAPTIDETMPIRVNVSDDDFYRNIEHACLLDLPWLQVGSQNELLAVLVGGGPSLAENLALLRRLYESGARFWAMNGSAIWLEKHGLHAHNHVLLDARPGNVRFLDYDRSGVHFFIASQCDASIFEALKDVEVTLWHSNSEGVAELTGERETALIGGGTTVGLQTASIAFASGHRSFAFFGYDSSYRGDDGHAYAQPENDEDALVEIFAGARKFRCAKWMAHQAEEFQDVARQLMQAGCQVSVHGDGLLPYVARVLSEPESLILDIGCDLGVIPASFDFIVWLVAAEMERARVGYGGLRITFLPGPRNGFRLDDLPPGLDERQKLFENVVLPSLSMVGARFGVGADLFPQIYTMRAITEAHRQGSPVPQLDPQVSAREIVEARLGDRRPVVITLREADYWPARNSDLDAWLEFAKECGDVIFVRDTAKADAPLWDFETFPEASTDLHVRLALYQRAKMNLTVSNGPGILLWFSGAPFRTFVFPVPGYGPHTPDSWEAMQGFAWGEQAPWFGPDQRIIYERDTVENIRASLEEHVNGAALTVPKEER